MQFAAVALFAASALAYTNVTSTTEADVYVTEVVTELTTYCPASTTLTFNGKTYTVTEATTLTITDCPCTITHGPKKPVPSSAAPTESTVVPTFSPENAAANAGVAGLAAVAGVAAYLL